MLRKEYCLIITLIVHLLAFSVAMNKVIILLGSNLGDRKYFLNKVTELIGMDVGLVLQVSSIYETEPIGFDSNNLFLNQVIIIETNYDPLALLRKLQTIEEKLGRKLNSENYQDRNIDIDILFYNNIQMESKELTIPHPQLHLREFTMIPLIEITGDYIHPVFGERLDKLPPRSCDNSLVKIAQYV